MEWKGPEEDLIFPIDRRPKLLSKIAFQPKEVSPIDGMNNEDGGKIELGR